IFAASRGTTRLGKNKTAQAFADGAIKGDRNEPIKTLAMFALPGVVGGGLKIASKLPAVGRIVSNPGAMKIASGIIGIAYSKNIYDRVNADVLDGYKDGNVSESSKTLPNGDIQITQTITQIPIMRKPTTNEKAERLGGIWGTEVGPMALGTIGLKIPGKARIKKLTSISAKKTIKKVYLKEKGKAKKFIRSEKAEVSYTKKKPVNKKQVQKLLQKTKTVEVIDFSKLVTTKPVDVIDFSKMKHVELAKIKIPTTVAKVTRSQLELKTKSLSNMPKSLDAQMKILSQVNAGKIKIKPNVQNAIITGRKTSIVHLNKQTTILESKIIQNSKSITKLRSKTKLTTKQSLKLKVLISTRTKQIIKLKILYYQIAISKTIISQVQKNKQLPALIQKSIQKPKSKTKTVTKILPKTKTVIKPKTKTIIKPRPKTKIIVKPKPFEIKKPKIIVIKPKKKSVKPVKKTKRKKKSEAWIVKNPIPTLKTFVG
ncbi:MAG: hypothetical protein MUP85_02055, partial [Candidatus Lokiarchaeota archaeon]|nr:hypothetical protein [Candidatus Lokiarchaeota archaeon]